MMYTRSRAVAIPTSGTVPVPLSIHPDTQMWLAQPTGGSPNAVRIGGPETVNAGGKGIYLSGIFQCSAAYPGDPCPATDMYAISNSGTTTVSIVEAIAEPGDPEFDLRRERQRGRKVA